MYALSKSNQHALTILASAAIACTAWFGWIVTASAEDFYCGTSLTYDGDGNAYRTTRIGNQCWMRENLRRGTVLSNPTMLPSVQGTFEKWCYGGMPSNCLMDGGLYTWAESLNQNPSCNSSLCATGVANNKQWACPVGWHVPNDSEFQTLVTLPSVTGCASGNMTCAPNTTGLFAPNTLTGWTVQSGKTHDFDALPIGTVSNGAYQWRMTSAAVWLRSEAREGTGMAMQFSFVSGSVRMQEQSKLTGASVRCLRDTDANDARYTIRGTFWSGASGATLTLCNSQILLDGSGSFIKQSIPFGTNCDTMKLEKTGFICSISETPSSEIRDNFELHGSCIEKAYYTVRWNFGTNASGATVNGCGKSATLGSTGALTFTGIESKTICSNFSLTKSGNTCQVTNQGPNSLETNFDWVAGSCDGGLSAYASGATYVPGAKFSYSGAAFSGTVQTLAVVGAGKFIGKILSYGISGSAKSPSPTNACDTEDLAVFSQDSVQVWQACNNDSPNFSSALAPSGGSYQWGNNSNSRNGAYAGSGMAYSGILASIPLASPHYGSSAYSGDWWANESTPYYPTRWQDQNRRGPCVWGYHVPTAQEWKTVLDLAQGMPRKTLRDALGIPYGGYRKFTGEWLESGLSAMYWSSTPSGYNALGVQFTDNAAALAEMPRWQGNSVKCVKDTSVTKTGSLSLTVNAGTNASGATLYACGRSLSLSSTGSATINDIAPGSDCSNAVIYKPGYICQWTANVPASMAISSSATSVCTVQSTTQQTTGTGTTTVSIPAVVQPDAKNFVLFNRVRVPRGSIPGLKANSLPPKAPSALANTTIATRLFNIFKRMKDPEKQVQLIAKTIETIDTVYLPKYGETNAAAVNKFLAIRTFLGKMLRAAGYQGGIPAPPNVMGK